MIDVGLHVGEGVPREQAAEARERLASLDAYTGEPVLSARLTLRRTGQMPPYAADASMLLDGRLLAAHATGRSVFQAADEVAERLRRQLLRVKEADVARRNEPRTIAAALRSLPIADTRSGAQLKPPKDREIIRRRPYSSIPMSTVDAVAELLDLDVLFHLFLHARTDEWVVVHRRDDERVGLIHPQDSVLADERDIVVPEPSRYSEPLSLEAARTEMDVLSHRFLYFKDADGRGRVLYLRHDGDYGLVEPE